MPRLYPPGYFVDPKTDKGYEGSAMCKATDKYCPMEYGDPCEEYNIWLKEEQNG